MRCESLNCPKRARFQCVHRGRYVMLCEDCRTALLTPYRPDPQVSDDAERQTETEGKQAEGETEV